MRTYDVMVKLATEAKPEFAADLGGGKGRDLVTALDRHFPVKGGWGIKPLCEGERLLRDVIAEK